MLTGEGFTYATKSCRIEYRCPNAYLQLDPITTTNLELVRNLRSGTAKQSLYGVLNHCRTSMGQVSLADAPRATCYGCKDFAQTARGMDMVKFSAVARIETMLTQPRPA